MTYLELLSTDYILTKNETITTAIVKIAIVLTLYRRYAVKI